MYKTETKIEKLKSHLSGYRPHEKNNHLRILKLEKEIWKKKPPDN